MESAMILGLLLLLLGIGLPVAWSFAGTIIALVIAYDINVTILMIQGFRSLNSVVLLALPLFILAGYLMQSGGIASRLIRFIELLLGQSRGGIGSAMIGASGFFGAVSGTATASVAAVGTLMVGPMEQRGYPRNYSAALLGISSLLGILIPPSITMILFAVATQQSVAALFAATIIPGVLLAIGLILFNRYQVGRLFHEELVKEKTSAREKLAIFYKSLPALFLPVIIIGGIYGGVFTPTEAAAFSVVAAIVVGFFFYRDLTLQKLCNSTISASVTTGSIILILLFSFVIGRILVAERVPQDLANLVSSSITNPTLIVILVVTFLIVVGALIDDVSVTVVIAPLLLPLMQASGVDPVHFAAIVATSVVIGSNSPPMAPLLFMSCKISKTSIQSSFKPAFQLIGFVALPIMLLTAFIPSISLALPRWLGLI